MLRSFTVGTSDLMDIRGSSTLRSGVHIETSMLECLIFRMNIAGTL